jgi:hypothetical protein
MIFHLISVDNVCKLNSKKLRASFALTNTTTIAKKTLQHVKLKMKKLNISIFDL